MNKIINDSIRELKSIFETGYYNFSTDSEARAKIEEAINKLMSSKGKSNSLNFYPIDLCTKLNLPTVLRPSGKGLKPVLNSSKIYEMIKDGSLTSKDLIDPYIEYKSSKSKIAEDKLLNNFSSKVISIFLPVWKSNSSDDSMPIIRNWVNRFDYEKTKLYIDKVIKNLDYKRMYFDLVYVDNPKYTSSNYYKWKDNLLDKIESNDKSVTKSLLGAWKAFSDEVLDRCYKTKDSSIKMMVNYIIDSIKKGDSYYWKDLDLGTDINKVKDTVGAALRALVKRFPESKVFDTLNSLVYDGDPIEYPYMDLSFKHVGLHSDEELVNWANNYIKDKKYTIDDFPKYSSIHNGSFFSYYYEALIAKIGDLEVPFINKSSSYYSGGWN